MTPNRIALGLALLLLVGTGIVVWTGTPEPKVEAPTPIPEAAPEPQKPWQAVPLDSLHGIDSGILTPGKGSPVGNGSWVDVSWTAWVKNTERKGEAVAHERFAIEGPHVLEGLKRLLPAMRVGETRQIHLPSTLAYGQTGKPPDIPRNADLVLELTLHEADTVIPVPDAPPVQPLDAEVDGIAFSVIEEGTGSPPKPGDPVALHFTLWNEDGTLVDSTLQRFRPVHVQSGRGQLLAGIERMVADMRVGERRKVRLPPAQEGGTSLIVDLQRHPIQ